MMTATWSPSLDDDDTYTFNVDDHDAVELPILLPEWQVVALEEAARDRGMTIGQLVRRKLSELFPRPGLHHTD